MDRTIEDYAFLGDARSAALVHRDGSIDWCCFPRFDSGACFAAILGTEDNGHWSVSPVGETTTVRRYVDDTLVLETTHSTATGDVRVTDALIPGRDDHRLVRVVEGVRGEVEMVTDLTVRFDYGSVVPWVRSDADGFHAAAGPEALTLRTPVALEGQDHRTEGRFVVRAGERVGFDLAWHPSTEAPPAAVDIDELVDDAMGWWRDWSARLRYDGAYPAAVTHSLRVLKALTFAPSGAFVAAPTTSLPEHLGGSRNWDYRYSWLRDSTMALLSLLEADCTDEAEAWRRWLVRAVAGDPSQLQIMYGVNGERRLPELELPWLAGFADSRPVRLGNAAATQRQLDVVGEVIDALYHARRRAPTPEDPAWDVQHELLSWLEDHWRDRDRGIWEVRSEPANITFSKVMCWVAFDRAVRSVQEHGLPGDVERWRAIRDEIHADVCANAVDEQGRFVQSYENPTLDASCLIIPLVGFLPADDPRVVATVDAVATGLATDGLLRRYDTDGAGATDGIDEPEGAFLLCSFWLVDCLVLMGRVDEAVERFERLLGLANDVGLLAEQYDVASGRFTGNFPQAFSHLALVGSAMMLCESAEGPNQSRSNRDRTDAAPLPAPGGAPAR